MVHKAPEEEERSQVSITSTFFDPNHLVVLGAEATIEVVSLNSKKDSMSGDLVNIPNGLASSPDLERADLLHLLLVALSVVGLRVIFKRALGLGAVLDSVVEVVEDGLEGVLEASLPVESTTASGGRASGVHPVHAVATNEGVERLGSLLNGLVESLRGRVAALTENLVLSEEHTVDTTHQATTLTVKVRVDLLLKGGLVEVTRADGDTEGDGLLLGLAGDVLEDGNGGVDATALLEERADGAAGTLGGDEDDIDVRGNLDLGEVLEDGGETVGEVEGLSSSAACLLCKRFTSLFIPCPW